MNKKITKNHYQNMGKFLFSLELCFLVLVVPAYGFDELDQFLKDKMIEKCTNLTNNTETSENMVKASLIVKEKCEENIITEQEYLADMTRAAQRGDTMASVFNTYCLKTEKYFDCNRIFFKSLHKCLDKEGLEEVAEYTNLLKETKNYICSEDGELLERFARNNGFKCFSEKIYKMGDCPINYEKYENETISRANMCSVFTEVEKCAIPIFKECPDDNNSIFQGLFNAVVHRHLCGMNGVGTNGLSQLVILSSIFLYSLFKF